MDNNWFIPDMSDYGKQITDLFKDMDLSVWQNSLMKTMQASMPDVTSYASAMADAIRQTVANDAMLPEVYLSGITELLKHSDYQNMVPQLVDTALERLKSLPMEEFEARQEIPAEEVQKALSGVKSCLPEEAVELVDAKVEEAQTADKKISNSDWIAIIGIIVTILLFIAGQLSSAEHEQKEESAWSALAEYQQESVELQKQDIELKRKILNHLNSSQNDFGEDDAGSESANEHNDHVVDPVDSQNQLNDQKTVQDSLQKQSDAEN